MWPRLLPRDTEPSRITFYSNGCIKSYGGGGRTACVGYTQWQWSRVSSNTIIRYVVVDVTRPCNLAQPDTQHVEREVIYSFGIIFLCRDRIKILCNGAKDEGSMH